MLLQITEPDNPAPLRERKRAAGIDLGTTHSLVASMPQGVATVLPDEKGRVLLPSVVRFGEHGETIVGHSALPWLVRDAANTIASVKRLMGRGLADLGDARQFPYQWVQTSGMVRLKTRAGEKNPIEISAEILKALRLRAETQLGGALEGVVVTVPAYFDDAQRQATKEAARLAGLNVLRLLNEPTAAAIAYGLDHGAEGVYVIYDLGGGTFDVSVLRLSRGVFEVLATHGDSALGGDDFDHRVFCWILEMAHLPPLAAEDVRLLLTVARSAKETLTQHETAPVVAVLSTGIKIELILTAEVFTEITRHLVQKTLTPLKRALRDAKLSVEEIKGVVLVGGATRMPQIRHAVAEFFKQPPLVNLDPDEVVALGAAIQANALVGNRGLDSGEDWLLLDVTPLSLGLETMGGLVEKIVPRNASIPLVRAQDFTTFKDGQTALAIHVVQGEREKVSDCRSLARFELRGIPPMVAGAARVRITFQIDADGLLSVSAREQTTGVEASVEVKPSYGLAESEIARMLEESLAHARDDMQARALVETQVEADQLIELTQHALTEDGDLLNERERAAIDAALTELAQRRQGQELNALRLALAKANRATAEFAGRRMDRSVQKALTGKRVDSVVLG
ncbi:MAG: Fe-S protein assembly chaperone HscA [Burkholderiales bacterium]|jgi:molecular chaperone HscA|nr:Fe-S protein assembly chaperone HscA [Burkholderiales bacterium]